MGSNSSLKVHSFARGIWDHRHHHHHQQQQQMRDLPSLTLGCKHFRVRPLPPPKLTNNNNNVFVGSFDLKGFIKPPQKDDKKDTPSPQVETHPGGTRWNPTQEQIGILEMLYKGGMRTPNAQQIEQITEQLSKYGKIEGKNVFYWFQNHKARERQKKKRNILGLTLDTRVEINQKQEMMSPYKRKIREWSFEKAENTNMKKNNQTLELFPLHPERR